MSKHTPGPWREEFVSDKTWHKGVYDVNGNEVALVKVKSALTAQRRDADARLIAAAPDLLDALKTCLLIVEHLASESAPSTIAEARAAIAKATGDTNA